jgi:hypothetical protein
MSRNNRPKGKNNAKRAIRALENGKAISYNNSFDRAHNSVGAPLSNSSSRAEKDMMKRLIAARKHGLTSKIKMEACLNKDCMAYCRLVQFPFDAPFENVHNPLFPDGGGMKAKTIRVNGEHTATIATGLVGTFLWIPNPLYNENIAQGGKYFQTYLTPTAVNRGVPGAPPCPITVGQESNCGYFCPGVGALAYASSITDTCNPLTWVSGPQFKGRYNQPTMAMYRLVAAGWRMINTTENQDLAGICRTASIPQSTSVNVNNTSVPYGKGGHCSDAKDTQEGIYIPSHADAHWAYVTDTNTATSSVANCRTNVQVQNTGSQTMSLTFEYVAIYEMAGQTFNGLDWHSSYSDEGNKVSNALGQAAYNRGEMSDKNGRLSKSIHNNLIRNHIEAEQIKSLPSQERDELPSSHVELLKEPGKGILKPLLKAVAAEGLSLLAGRIF